MHLLDPYCGVSSVLGDQGWLRENKSSSEAVVLEACFHCYDPKEQIYADALGSAGGKSGLQHKDLQDWDCIYPMVGLEKRGYLSPLSLMKYKHYDYSLPVPMEEAIHQKSSHACFDYSLDSLGKAFVQT